MKRTFVASLAIAGMVAPAWGQDTGEKVGIAGALGLTAATGKTTLNDGAGSIEAALLNSDAIDQAGRIIAALTRQVAPNGALVLSRSEKVDLVTGKLIRNRLVALTKQVKSIDPKDCAKAGTITVKPEIQTLDGLKSKPIPFDVSDITAAIATDATIGSIALSVDDRMLVQSVVMNGDAEPLTLTSDDSLARWLVAPPIRRNRAIDDKKRLIVPAEVAAFGTSATVTQYEALLTEADTRRKCSADDAKAKVGAVDAFATSINTPPEKGGPTPLGQAILTEKFENPKPYILRVAAEEAKGTSIVSANIWYTLGIMPDAATVSSGLLASFRLIDADTGNTVLAGFVRCAARPINIKHGQRIVRPDEKGQPRTTCAYRASSFSANAEPQQAAKIMNVRDPLSPATPATGG